MEAIRYLWQDESGASAVEYTLLIGFIALVIISAANTFGHAISNMFTNVSNTISTAS